MSKHTPGPWKWARDEYGYDRNLDPFVIAGTVEGLIDVSDEDGRLIAAAPDLLAALELIVSEADSYTARTGKPVHNWLDSARAAIARAKGEAV
jgi:hypothetical protein